MGCLLWVQQGLERGDVSLRLHGGDAQPERREYADCKVRAHPARAREERLAYICVGFLPFVCSLARLPRRVARPRVNGFGG